MSRRRIDRRMRKTEPRQILSPPRRTPRERTLDRLKVMGALLIAFGIVVAAAVVLL
jgi:hypothetical protein